MKFLDSDAVLRTQITQKRGGFPFSRNKSLGSGEKIKSQQRISQFTVSRREIDNFLTECIAEGFETYLLFKTAYYQALRVSEIANLNVEDIDFNSKIITIRNSKFNKTRVIPITEGRLLHELKRQAHERKTGALFVNMHRRRWSVRAIQDLYQKLGEKYNIKNKHPNRKHFNTHLLRHSRARHLKDERYPEEFVKEFLGHESIRTTVDLYGTPSINDLKRMVVERTNDPILAKEKIVPEVLGAPNQIMYDDLSF